MRICRRWFHAALDEKCRNVDFSYKTVADLVTKVYPSPLRYHISLQYMKGLMSYDEMCEAFTKLPSVTQSQVNLAHRTKNMQNVNLLPFGSKLKELFIQFHTFSEGCCSRVLESIGASPTITRLTSISLPLVTLEPLILCATLSSLNISPKSTSLQLTSPSNLYHFLVCHN